MKRPHYQALTIMEFQSKFSTEEACRGYLRQMRWPSGYECPCGSRRNAYKPSRHEYQCYDCHRVCSVTAGTVMHRSKVPLRKWFWCMYLMATSKKTVSSLYLSRELRLNYKTAWSMRRKIQIAMAHRDQQWTLKGTLSADEFFLGRKQSNKERVDQPKGAFFIALQEDRAGRPQFAKIEGIASAFLEGSLGSAIDRHIPEGSTLKSDGKGAYVNASYRRNLTHERVVAMKDPKTAHAHLNWINIVVSNLKRYLLSTHHGVFPKHRQHYVDEFLYRFNRRFWPEQAFDRLVFANLFKGPTPLRAT